MEIWDGLDGSFKLWLWVKLGSNLEFGLDKPKIIYWILLGWKTQYIYIYIHFKLDDNLNHL